MPFKLELERGVSNLFLGSRASESVEEPRPLSRITLKNPARYRIPLDKDLTEGRTCCLFHQDVVYNCVGKPNCMPLHNEKTPHLKGQTLPTGVMCKAHNRQCPETGLSRNEDA